MDESEYTPTTDEVREAYVDRKDFEAQVYHLERLSDNEYRDQFDRWLKRIQS